MPITSYGPEAARAYHRMRTIGGGIFAPYNTFIDMPGMEAALKPFIRQGTRALDAGCGTGISTSRIASMGADVVGIDNSPEMVAIAKEEYPGIEFLVRDAQQTGFPDQSFDMVSSGLMVHYKPDLKPLYAEISRILVPGGRFIYTTGHPVFEMFISDQAKLEQGQRTITLDPYYKKGDRAFTWTMPDEHGNPLFEMVSYRYNIQEHTEALFANGLLVERIVELRPAPEMEAVSPQIYRFTSQFPSFILFQAIKANI